SSKDFIYCPNCVAARRKLVRVQHGRATVSRPRQRAGESDTSPSRRLITTGTHRSQGGFAMTSISVPGSQQGSRVSPEALSRGRVLLILGITVFLAVAVYYFDGVD